MGFKSLGRDVKISDRAALYNVDQLEIGDYSRIDDFCVVSGKVTLGRYVHIAVFCNVAGGSEGITIDDFSGFAYGVHAFSQSDDYTGQALFNPTIPDKFKLVTRQPIHLERYSIVGTQSVILPGVTLAEGTAVGAMSMVTTSTKPWGVYFGIPARLLRHREQKLVSLAAQLLEEDAARNAGQNSAPTA